MSRPDWVVHQQTPRATVALDCARYQVEHGTRRNGQPTITIGDVRQLAQRRHQLNLSDDEAQAAIDSALREQAGNERTVPPGNAAVARLVLALRAFADATRQPGEPNIVSLNARDPQTWDPLLYAVVLLGETGARTLADRIEALTRQVLENTERT